MSSIFENIKGYLNPVNKYDTKWQDLDSQEQRLLMEWAITEIEYLQRPKMGLLQTFILMPFYTIVTPISLYLSYFPYTFPMTLIMWGLFLILG